MLITDQKALEKYSREKCLWIGIPSIEVTPGGRTFLTFYSGGRKEEIGNYVLLVKSENGSDFGEPVAVCFAEGYRCYDPCIWIDPLGRLWLTWSRCPEDGLYGAICQDPDAEEIVFGKEFFIGHNVMMNKPLVLSTGEWLFPLAVWNREAGVRVLPAAYDFTGLPPGSYACVTADGGNSFQMLGCADVKKRGFDEHMFLEMRGGALRVFVRTVYGIGAADSYDGGRHWGADFDTGYQGPCSRFHIRRLPSGRILLINHDHYSGRNNLTAMLSEDEGQTFPYRLLLDERSNVAYPDAAVDAAGKIHITYDRERGAFCRSIEELAGSAREILTACVEEADILAGQIVSPGSYLKRVAWKLTFPDMASLRDGRANESYARLLSANGRGTEEILSEIFDAYQINCANIHHIEAKQLDRLIQSYQANRDLETLNQIVSLVRSASGKSAYPEKKIADEICRYVADHPEEDCGIENIAEKFHYSAHYLRHIFKKQTGLTLTEFKNAQIIKKAKVLLRTGGHTVTAIAAACGFENSSYFAEFFSKECGISPTDYRKNCR